MHQMKTKKNQELTMTRVMVSDVHELRQYLISSKEMRIQVTMCTPATGECRRENI
jgi:hypothetical protein